MKNFKIAAKLLEMVAWRNPQDLIGDRIADHPELSQQPLGKFWRNVRRADVVIKEIPQSADLKPENYLNQTASGTIPPDGTLRINAFEREFAQERSGYVSTSLNGLGVCSSSVCQLRRHQSGL